MIVGDTAPGVALFTGVAENQGGSADYLNGVWVPGTEGILTINADVFASWQRSANLQPGSWVPMIQGADYLLDSILDGGHQQEFTLELLDAPPVDPRSFYRIELDPNS